MKLNENFEIHSTLNSDLFNTETSEMHPDVHQALMKVAAFFLEDYLDSEIPIIDIRVVGSNASYNYTAASDIDLHIVTNFEQLTPCVELISQLFQLQKSKFNADYNIKVKGREVEVYVEDLKAGAVSNGVYSILKNDWVKFPKQINANIEDTSEDVVAWIEDIETAINTNNISDVQDCINRLYLMRKDSIAAEGEYSYGNQVFKDIRNLGYLNKLKSTYKDLKSSDLTLEDLNEECEIKWY